MDTPPPRIVTLVLVDAGGVVLGSLAPIQVDTPWWMDMAPVHRAVRARDGAKLTVLRLLDAERPGPHGGAVSYLAQLDAPCPLLVLRPWPGRLTEHPLRRGYAHVGGPQADLAWASAALQAHGAALTDEPEQIRTWNLSSLWRLPTTLGPAWLKVVPPFFAHEGTVLAALATAPVPRLLGHERERCLLAHVPGDDHHDAPLPLCLAMIDLLVTLQAAWLGRADELLALGLPDWRGPAFTVTLRRLLARRTELLDDEQRGLLEDFVDGLPQRFAAIAACGLGEGLVHGDFHPGNLRGEGERLTLLDWGDSGIGHPLLDQPAFLDRLPADGVETARRQWAQAWHRAIPGADVDGAARRLAPVASARQALIYQRFIDGIEDSEQPYHQADVGLWLQRTAALLHAEATP